MFFVHMNGRIYDPLLGRFLSADVHVQFPGDLQSFNRYSYVSNNPVRFTDPTGFSLLGDIVAGLNRRNGGVFQSRLMGAAPQASSDTSSKVETQQPSTQTPQPGGTTQTQTKTSGKTDQPSGDEVQVQLPDGPPRLLSAKQLADFDVKLKAAMADIHLPEGQNTEVGVLSNYVVTEQRVPAPSVGAVAVPLDLRSSFKLQLRLCWRPDYEPGLWNDGGRRGDGISIQGNSNCYAYACNKRGPFSGGFGMQPGDASGQSPLVQSQISVQNVRARAVSDGLSPIPMPGGSPVVLVVAPGVDYHWYRQDSDGNWSHKPGHGPVTNLDASGNVIADPATANRQYPYANYTELGGTLWVPPGFQF